MVMTVPRGQKKTYLSQPKAALQLDNLEREEKEEEKKGFEGQQLFIVFFSFNFLISFLHQ